MKIISLSFLIFSSLVAYSQNSVMVFDQETGDPIPGVLIQIVDSNDKNLDGFITNFEGKAAHPYNGNYYLLISHVSYTSEKLPLQPGNLTIRMKPNTTTLGDVVITGQYHPQSAENSVYSVRAIDNETIQKQGAIQLSDVLSKELNILYRSFIQI